MRRAPLVTGALLLAVGAAPATAAGPQLTDPRGDHPVAAGDILSAAFTTIGARALQIDLVVAAAPSQVTPYSYAVTFETTGCNFKAVYYSHPAGPLGFESTGVGCDDGRTSELPPGEVSVSGATITYRVPLDRTLRRGVTLTRIRAATTASGLLTAAEPTPYVQDTAATDATYRIGS